MLGQLQSLLIRNLIGLIGLVMTGCGSMPSEEQKLACGQQCLKNGENCSQFFARKNEERRLDFEQARENYWMCMRRYPTAKSVAETPCIAPPPNAVKYDTCGQELEECMAACKTTLDEVATFSNPSPDMAQRDQRTLPNAPEEPGGGSGPR